MVFGKGICNDWYTANDEEGGGKPCGKGLHLGAGARSSVRSERMKALKLAYKAISQAEARLIV